MISYLIFYFFLKRGVTEVEAKKPAIAWKASIFSGSIIATIEIILCLFLLIGILHPSLVMAFFLLFVLVEGIFNFTFVLVAEKAIAMPFWKESLTPSRILQILYFLCLIGLIGLTIFNPAFIISLVDFKMIVMLFSSLSWSDMIINTILACSLAIIVLFAHFGLEYLSIKIAEKIGKNNISKQENLNPVNKIQISKATLCPTNSTQLVLDKSQNKENIFEESKSLSL